MTFEMRANHVRDHHTNGLEDYKTSFAITWEEYNTFFSSKSISPWS